MQLRFDVAVLLSLIIVCLSFGSATLPTAASQTPVSLNSQSRFPIPRSPVAAARYQPEWSSLDTRPIPEWYEDAKFGIFMHWGLYSVPSYNTEHEGVEWYWHSLYYQDPIVNAWHAATYGPNFRYQDFASMWKAELFNASSIASLLKRSGARYVVPTAKHHEGFTLWPSAQSWNWNSVDVGPHRDLLGELMGAVRGEGLHAAVYFSLLDWFHPFYFAKDITRYVNEVMYPQWVDLIDHYKPDLLWLDGDWEWSSKAFRSEEFLAYVYNDSPVKDTIVVNDRFGNDTWGVHGGYYVAEKSDSVNWSHKWELCSTLDKSSWGMNRFSRAEDYWSVAELLNTLVRTVSNGGNFLLNVGPFADGTVSPIMEERLLSIGAWLAVNGEAIYASRMWRVKQEGGIDTTTVRYTQSKDGKTVYAFLLVWPDDFSITLSSVRTTGGEQQATVEMLGYSTPLSWKPQQTGGIVVQLPHFSPSNAPCTDIWVLRMTGFA